MKNLSTTILALACCLALAADAVAETWLVTPDGLGDFGTIQAAIEAAEPGDVVELGDGVFTGPGNRDLDFLGKAITVRSQSGDAAACIIDCQGTVEENHRGVNFRSGETADARLEHLTITGGYRDVGNLPEGCGGAILVSDDSAPTLVGLILRQNVAQSGGAIYVFTGSPVIAACLFLENDGWWGSGGGLGLYQYTASEPITDCVFQANHSHQAGGGISAVQSDFALEACQFMANTLTSGYGGGLECFMESVCEVTGCTFADNVGDLGGGGAMFWWDSVGDLRRCTFAGNVSAQGSGIGAEDSQVTVLESIIAFGTGPSVRVTQGGTMTLGCCDVFGNSEGDWVGEIADQAGQAFNRSADPLFCGDANPEAPYSLQAESPCAPGYPCPQIGAWTVGCGITGIAPALPDGEGLVLRGAAPNPFNPQTTITFGLDREQRVEVAVFDARGRQVAVLADRIFGAGETSLRWDGRDAAGRDLASGVFLVRVRSAGQTRTTKAVLIR